MKKVYCEELGREIKVVTKKVYNDLGGFNTVFIKDLTFGYRVKKCGDNYIATKN